MKTYYIMYGVGSSKYTINYHDGVQTHKDGSPFYGIRLFSNKRKFEAAIKEMEREGYKPL
jgi:hypothetical protein